MDCIFCFEQTNVFQSNYKCTKKCFFNNNKECNICSQCLTNWLELNMNENHKYEKCPICSNWSLKNTNERCIECVCNCKIKYNRIYPNVLNEDSNRKCKHRAKLIVLIVLIYVVYIGLGFCITNLWYYLNYNEKDFESSVKEKKWNEPEYYIVICPGITLIIFLIIVCFIGFCRCLENIC